MEDVVENLIDVLTDSLDHIYDLKMREHIKSQIRQANESLEYRLILKLESQY